MKTTQVLCYGEVLWDTFGNEEVPGGAPMNVALHLIKQGINAAMVSRIGNDAAGKKLSDFLLLNQLNTQLVQVDDTLPTCRVTVKLDEHQHATYTIPQPVSWDNIQPSAQLLQAVQQAQVIVFGSLVCRSKTSKNTLLTLLTSSNLLRVFDVNLRAPHYELPTIQTLATHADVIKMNDDEADMLMDHPDEPFKNRMMAFQQKYNLKTVCITRGEHGAIVYHEGVFYEHPGFKTHVVDTVGAGDSFLATLIAGIVNQQPMQQVIEKACAVGALVAGQRGANPVYNEEQIGAIVADKGNINL